MNVINNLNQISQKRAKVYIVCTEVDLVARQIVLIGNNHFESCVKSVSFVKFTNGSSH